MLPFMDGLRFVMETGFSITEHFRMSFFARAKNDMFGSFFLAWHAKGEEIFQGNDRVLAKKIWAA
jgi:hypothetical protein